MIVGGILTLMGLLMPFDPDDPMGRVEAGLNGSVLANGFAMTLLGLTMELLGLLGL